jgi:cbb3-type cytochrome oxidase subunit 3
MQQHYYYRILSGFFFLAGIFFLYNSQLNITGAVLGASLEQGENILIGMSLIFISATTYILEPTRKKIHITSAIKRYHDLVKLARQATKDSVLQREINHLEEELYKGNMEAGLGAPGHIRDTEIEYFRGRHGARLYYRLLKVTNNTADIEIVGKSGKGGNQERVIKKLKEHYPK